MASVLLEPLLPKLQQTKATAGRAAALLRSAFPIEHAKTSDTNIGVQLPRRDVPTYVLPNSGAQPWELLPMKAAAMAQYPNFFNNSCMFFGSINRDVTNGVPFCLLRPTRLAIDLAKVTRNLGIVDGFSVVQKRHKLGPHDFVWTSDQPEPQDMYDMALFKHRYLRLQLRTDMFSPQPLLSHDTSRPAHPPLPLAAQLAPAFGLLPLSVKNISKASRPVLMYPKQLEVARSQTASGVFICYHHELGIITDSQAEHYDVPALVAAHVGLPLSMVTQIRGALAAKARAEAGKPLRHVTQLKDYNLVEELRRQVAARHQRLAGQARAQAAELDRGAKERLGQVKREIESAEEERDALEAGVVSMLLVKAGLAGGVGPQRRGGQDMDAQ